MEVSQRKVERLAFLKLYLCLQLGKVDAQANKFLMVRQSIQLREGIEHVRQTIDAPIRQPTNNCRRWVWCHAFVYVSAFVPFRS